MASFSEVAHRAISRSRCPIGPRLEEERIICWNCHEASSGNFMQEMKELLRSFKLAIVVLLESKVSGVVADGICKRIRMSRWGHSEATSFSSGIWVLWNEAMTEIEIKHAHKYFVHLAITLLDGRKWELTTVYASPNTSRRRGFWSKLVMISFDNPWALIEDINCVLKAEERSTDSGASTSFAEWVDHTGHINLGYFGSKYTWNYGVLMQTRKLARLDRALCDEEWRRIFHSASIPHLSYDHSDHCPLLLSLQTDEGSHLGDHPSRFVSA